MKTNEETTQITVVFPKTLLRTLDGLRFQLRKSSRAEIIREACEDYLQKRQLVVEPDISPLTKAEIKAIRRGLEDIKKGRGKPWREALAEI